MAATTNGETTSQGRKFPEIILDATLSDLLAEEPDYNIKESLCNVKPCADPRHTILPLNKKYLITSAQAEDSAALAHLQLENVTYLLSFWAGPMEVPMIACDGMHSGDDTLTKDIIQGNAEKSFSVLGDKQRPRPKTFANKDEFVEHYGAQKTRVRWGFAVDFSERMSSFVHAEVQYLLNSKRWLAECPLRSANDRIIDPECSCSKHKTKGGFWYFGSDCDECKNTVEKEVDRLKSKLQNTPPPFVLKISQALGSAGTMLVKNEDDRDKTIKQITEIQKECLPYINAENAHIHPASLVLSDFLPGITNALNFYVRRDGSIKFFGACHQLSTRTTEGGRQHTALTWDHQEEAEKKFKDSLAEIGKVLKGQGYFGPCGADIMETEDGTQYVIDLNVRTATSLILGLLKGHCEKRGFGALAVYECLLLGISREGLEKEFEKEFEEGRFIVLGNTRLGKKDVWAYPVVIAGKDQDAVKELGARILKFESTGGSDAQDAGGA